MFNCFPCFNGDDDADAPASDKDPASAANNVLNPNVKTYTFRELAMATKNFRQECLLGDGGFGRVFKGTIQATKQVVAVKQLDRNGMHENKEFTAEVVRLSHLNHSNLVNLIGYCADGDQRVLVYEYVPTGSLEQHLLGDDPDKKPLDWDTRMKVAAGAAQGLEYLHEQVNPPVIYADLKPSNVLLTEDFEPKLSDVGLSKFGSGDHQSSRMMGTYGYSAPEYSKGEEVTLKSDIYSFGVVLLELITGRKAIDTSKPTDEQNLVTWAQPFFRDPKRFSEMADPRLNKQFPATSLNQAVGIAAMCIQDEPMVRPLISDVTAVLGSISLIPNVPQPQTMEYEKETQQDKDSAERHSSSSSSSSHSESSEQSQGSHLSDEESGSYDSESVDQSDEEGTDQSNYGGSSVDNNVKERTKSVKQGRAVTNRVRSRQKSSREGKAKGVSTGTQTKDCALHSSVVTFKEPNKRSRYKAGGKSQTKGGNSSSSEESRSDSEDEGGSTRHQKHHSR